MASIPAVKGGSLIRPGRGYVCALALCYASAVSVGGSGGLTPKLLSQL